MNKIILTAMASLLFSAAAIADDENEKPEVIYKQRTEIDFEGVEVQGELVRPQGALLLQRRAAHFNPLIKLRTDFDDEISKSVDEVK